MSYCIVYVEYVVLYSIRMWLRPVIVFEKFCYSKEQTTAITKIYNTTLIALKQQILNKWKIYFSISESLLFPHGKPKNVWRSDYGCNPGATSPCTALNRDCLLQTSRQVSAFFLEEEESKLPTGWLITGKKNPMAGAQNRITKLNICYWKNDNKTKHMAFAKGKLF